MLIQVAQLVVAVVAAAAYVFFMLLPFIQSTWTETRRVAELLAQVMNDIKACDVVILVIL